MRNLFASTALAALALAGAASAQTATDTAASPSASASSEATASAATTAKAGTDLNLRSGPGVQHEVVGVIPGGADVSVAGCIEAANWCEVTYDGKTGWAYGDYLAAQVGEAFQPIYPNRQALNIAVVEYREGEPSAARQAADAGMGATAGAAAGALIAGPLGAVVGAAAGGAASQLPEPAPEVRTYIEANPQPPVLVEGEVVIGAGVPETVTLYDIPEATDYRYATINGLPVLVGADRKIVYIYR